MPGAPDTAGHRFSPSAVDGVCRMALQSPGLCCYGGCLEEATHAVVLDVGLGQVEHHRCPTHLAWSQEKQAAAIVSTSELT